MIGWSGAVEAIAKLGKKVLDIFFKPVEERKLEHTEDVKNDWDEFHDEEVYKD